MFRINCQSARTLGFYMCWNWKPGFISVTKDWGNSSSKRTSSSKSTTGLWSLLMGQSFCRANAGCVFLRLCLFCTPFLMIDFSPPVYARSLLESVALFEADLEKVSDRHAQLIGHVNKKQKIRYTVGLGWKVDRADSRYRLGKHQLDSVSNERLHRKAKAIASRKRRVANCC